MNPFKILAQKLDQLPNGYPATTSGVEIRILEKLFTLQEAQLAGNLLPYLEAPNDLAVRLGAEMRSILPLLKEMSKKGLIKVGRTEGRLAFALLPFVVGIYEMQANRIDRELAFLFEEYYKSGFGKLLEVKPQVHRVVPVRESVRQDMEIHPYESVSEILQQSKAWGVVDCICRTQKALIGEPCSHPLDVCMIMSEYPNAFAGNSGIRSLTQIEAQKTLDRAAQAGLVHSVSNNQEGLWYICNCCTCACGILRGMIDFGYANVIARSSFINHVDEERCIACGVCQEACQFHALEITDIAQVAEQRCVGCGVCISHCPEDALSLIKRPANQIKPPPLTENDWIDIRVSARKFSTP